MHGHARLSSMPRHFLAEGNGASALGSVDLEEGVRQNNAGTVSLLFNGGTDFVRLFNRRTAVAIFVIISVLVVLVLQQYPQLFLPLCLREVEKARAVIPERTGSPALVHLIAMVLPRMPCNQVQQSRGTGRITLARSCMNQRRKS